MSPRRSSRARTSQPSPLVATQTTSSSSSVASDRAQRATRSHNKLGSPQRSIPRSQSQDEPEEPAKPPPRRTRSGHNEIKEPTPSVDLNGDLDDEEAQEEDEITRCVCGQSEYPGLSTPLIDLLQKAGYVPPGDQAYEQLGDVFLCCDKCHVWQHAGCVGILGKINEPDSYYCDECRRDLHKVATSMEGQRYSRYVPVMDEPPYRRSPKPSTRNGKSKDRPRSNTDATQHKRRVTMNSRNMDEELARVIEESKRENGSNNGSLSAAAGATRNGKRGRDEDDEYVNAIMTSDSDSATRTTSHALAPTRAAAAADHFASRRKSITKRQRTESSSPPQEPKDEASEDDGGEAADDAAIAAAVAAATPATAAVEATEDVTPKKSIRGAAVRNSNQVKEAREQRERERQAAATARKVRSERRRGEDSDNEEPTIEQPPSTAASSPPPEPTPASVRTTMVSNKKKPTPARRGRMGRNQHTRERDSPGPELGEENTSGLLATNPHNTRARSRSRSLVRGEEPGSERKGGGGGVSTPNGSSGGVGTMATTATVAVTAVGSTESKAGGGIIKANFTFDDGGLLAKPSKARNFNEKKTSLNEMKKRVAAILEFVQRAQAERPAEGSRGGGGGGGGGGGDGGSSSAGMSRSASMAGVPVMTNGAGVASELKSGLPAVTVDAGGAGIKSLADEADDGATREAFEHLSAAEMLVSLKTRLVAFEGNFGRWGDSRT